MPTAFKYEFFTGRSPMLKVGRPMTPEEVKDLRHCKENGLPPQKLKTFMEFVSGYYGTNDEYEAECIRRQPREFQITEKSRKEDSANEPETPLPTVATKNVSQIIYKDEQEAMDFIAWKKKRDAMAKARDARKPKKLQEVS